MMRRFRKHWLLGGCAAILIVLIAVIALNAALPAPKDDQADVEVTQRIDNNKLWDEALLWNRASGEFSSNSDSPVLLLRTDDLLLYVVNGELRFARKGIDQGVLIHYREKQKLQHWSEASGLLLGGAPEAVPVTGEPANYQWNYIRLPLETDPAASVMQMGQNHIAPTTVVKVKAIKDPERLFIETLSAGVRNEYMLTPGSDTVSYVNSILPPDMDAPDISHPKGSEGIITMLSSDQPITTPKQSIRSFLVDGGTLLYQAKPSESVVFFPGLAYDSSISFPTDKEGEELFALLLKSTSGKKFMVYPDEMWLFPWNPALSTPGWKAHSKYLLYRLTDSLLETVSYRYVGNSLELHHATLPLEQLAFQRQTGTRFDFTSKQDQSSVQISLYDLSNTRTPNPETTDLQIRAGWDGVPTSTEKRTLFPYYEERQVPFSKHDPERWPAHIPTALREELEHLAGMGSGDGWSSTTFHEDKGTWYVLQYDRLSRFVLEPEPGHRLEYVATLPIGISCSISNVSSCRTAEGLLHAFGYWFIADTYNDRLLKLDENFAIIDETELLLPARIGMTDQNVLSVEAVTGTHTFDLDLHLESKLEHDFSKVPAASKTTANISPSAYLEDPLSGLLWYYESGYLHQYRKNTNTIRTFYVSHMENARGVFRILPYKDRIIAFSDHRMLQFRRKDGGFLQAFCYDRAVSDGIYNTTPLGENSYVVDEHNGRLYMVQGYRILGIDLETGDIQELFRQDGSNMGSIVLYQNSLLFTLQPGGTWPPQGEEDPGLVNQLVRLDLGTGRTARYGIPDNYYSGRLIGTDLVLSFFEPHTSESTTGMRIPLDQME